jgi:hypothetical protein
MAAAASSRPRGEPKQVPGGSPWLLAWQNPAFNPPPHDKTCFRFAAFRARVNIYLENDSVLPVFAQPYFCLAPQSLSGQRKSHCQAPGELHLHPRGWVPFEFCELGTCWKRSETYARWGRRPFGRRWWSLLASTTNVGHNRGMIQGMHTRPILPLRSAADAQRAETVISEILTETNDRVPLVYVAQEIDDANQFLVPNIHALHRNKHVVDLQHAILCGQSPREDLDDIDPRQTVG